MTIRPIETVPVPLADLDPAGATDGDVVKRVAGAWTHGAAPAGSQIFTGSGAPGGGLGANGDYYIDTTPVPPNLYGPKASGSWPSPVALGGGGATYGYNAASADVNVTTSAFVDLCTVTISGTRFMCTGDIQGLTAAGMTFVLRIDIDAGTRVVECYSDSAGGAGNAVLAFATGNITGLSAGSHTIKLQAKALNSSMTVNAVSSPNREGAHLAVTSY